MEIFDNFFLIYRMDDEISLGRIITLARRFDVSMSACRLTIESRSKRAAVASE